MSPEAAPRPGRSRFRLGLFWRTFFLLTALILVSMLAWLQTLQAMENEARDIQAARSLASVVNLSRASLMHLDGIARIALIKVMGEEEGLHIALHRSDDQVVLLDPGARDYRVAEELVRRLGADTVVASRVNGREGFWIGFVMQGDKYWLRATHEKWALQDRSTWMVWLALATAFSLAGAALIARLINRPLKALLFAASRVREGRFEASRLDEQVPTHEIRDVNIGFNRMAQRLAQAEQDRVVMLAGISHDLRTPLARLRLEVEMSVPDPSARSHMASDIEQLDAIVDKFLDYARPQRQALERVVLQEVVQASSYAFAKRADVQLDVRIPPELAVLSDAVELGRVLSNLLENACRYAKSPDTGQVRIEMAARREADTVEITVRDHGPGVEPSQLRDLLQPFYRGEAARTAAQGAGLGLAIVDKTVRRMGGHLALDNAQGGGLRATIRLALAS